MPYISSTDDRRKKLQNGDTALTAGELNYQIFYFIKHNWHIRDYHKIYPKMEKFVNNFLGEKPNYQKYNDITGCLIRCAREIKRRIIEPHEQNRLLGDYMALTSSCLGRLYTIRQWMIKLMSSYDEAIDNYEDTKIKENGDVE